MMDTTDIPAPDTDRDRDAAMVTMVTTEEAAHLAGVSARTIRRWIQRGLLVATEGASGQLVSPADLPTAKQAAGHGRGHGRGHGHRAPDMVMDADTTDVAVSPAARSQLEAIRDEWLRPMMERNEELARQLGRVEQERDQLRVEVDRLYAATEPSAAPGEAERQNMSHTAARPWWRFWDRLSDG
jgi:excisionase family DNA binding protein